MRIARLATATVVVATLALAAGVARGATYAVRVRWNPSTSSGVTGYRITVQTVAGATLPVVDAGLPAAASDGSLAAVVTGLDGRTDYQVSMTAYDAQGQQSAPSNALAIGYAQVAARIDTDGDGLSDAQEDPNLNRVVDPGETDPLRSDTDGDGIGDASDHCQATAAGAAVNGMGCSCAQVTCDDGNVCNGVETCTAGVCAPGSPPACDDGSACTVDACDPRAGCTHRPAAGCCTSDADCADQDRCTTAERCQAGACVSTPVVCPPSTDGCRSARCEPQTGCVSDLRPDGTACDDGDACTIGDTCRAGTCAGTLDAPTSGPRGVGPRRFVIHPAAGGYALSAAAQFPFPDDLDLATSGLSVIFEDGAQHVVLGVDLAGSDLTAKRSGWQLARPGDVLRRLEVRPSTGTARVTLRGTLPEFALLDASGAPAGSAPGALTWRVRFGQLCSGTIAFACTDDARGRRRCDAR